MLSISKLFLFVVLVLALSACSSSDSSSGDAPEPEQVTMRVISEQRTSADGSISTNRTSYTTLGHLEKQVYSQGDTISTTLYETASDGSITRSGSDIDNDGIEDEFRVFEYIAGLGLKRINLFDANGLLTGVFVYTYEGDRTVFRDTLDIQGATTLAEFDEASAPVIFNVEFQYEGRRFSTALIDSDVDGMPDGVDIFTYNPNGTLAMSNLNSTTDGAVSTTVYTYEEGVCKAWGSSLSEYNCVVVE